MRLIHHDHGIFLEIWVVEAFSQEHAIRQVLDLRLWAREVLETDCVANFLAERAANLLSNAFCNGRGGEATGLCATYPAEVCVSIFEEILCQLSCLACSRVSDNDEDLVLLNGQRYFHRTKEY